MSPFPLFPVKEKGLCHSSGTSTMGADVHPGLYAETGCSIPKYFQAHNPDVARSQIERRKEAVLSYQRRKETKQCLTLHILRTASFPPSSSCTVHNDRSAFQY